jgi:alkylated DNA repair dioxygenase AlkB
MADGAPEQTDLFGAPPAEAPDAPEGFRYTPDLLSPAEAAALVEAFEGLGFRPFQFYGYLGHRETVSYGWRYDYADRVLKRAEPLPGWLEPARAKAEAFAGLAEGALVQALITRYAPGTTIGWHRDRPDFEVVVGISLLSPAVLRFRRKAAGQWERRSLTVLPRSAYVLDGPARREWEHSLRPVEALRYSVTFRSLSRK